MEQKLKKQVDVNVQSCYPLNYVFSYLQEEQLKFNEEEKETARQQLMKMKTELMKAEETVRREQLLRQTVSLCSLCSLRIVTRGPTYCCSRTLR